MKKYGVLFIFFHFACFFIFTTEPDVSEEYYIQDGERILYIGMTVEEVKLLLGEPKAIEISKRNIPFHGFDVVTWVYSEIEVVFFDVSIKGGVYNLNTISMIIIPNIESPFKIGGDISPHGKTMEEIKAIFGDPKEYGIKTNNGYTYYEYVISLLGKGPNTYFLQFRFNDKGICDKIFLISDDFFI